VNLDDTLRGQGAVELRPEVIEYALLLSVQVGLGDLCPLRPFRAAQP